MMARSTTRSNQRPDTLMQDRRRQLDEIFLQRTTGPYIWVIHGLAIQASDRGLSAMRPIATVVAAVQRTTLRANSGPAVTETPMLTSSRLRNI
jgi:hypothetical protein